VVVTFFTILGNFETLEKLAILGTEKKSYMQKYCLRSFPPKQVIFFQISIGPTNIFFVSAISSLKPVFYD